ncbi:MAG TPA: response regulator transcription factor [Vicinamibacterales bacterium]|jgi:two-component system response regulator NreC|nr:response regulator transcription factor [Vicinamibacterales bacterium]
MPLRILLADDHQIVRQGVRALLEKHGMQVVAECCDGREAVQLAARHNPDVAVLDVTMPGLNGVDAARQILEQRPSIGVVLLTFQTSEPQVAAALRAGIRGYVLKTQTSDDLVRALREVAARGTYLSPGISHIVVTAYLNGSEPAEDPLTAREREVLQLVAEGRTTKEIAAELGLSAKTAESYRGRLMQKLEIHETAGLVRYAIRQGLIQAVIMCLCVGNFVFDPAFTDLLGDALDLIV